MELIENTGVPDVDARLNDLADRYRRAGGFGVDVLNMIGGKAEGLLDRLPAVARDGLQQATHRALLHAVKAANQSRSIVPDQKGWLNAAVGAAMGAVGGAGGLPTALAELPVTTTLLLRVIQGVSREYGFDPAAENVQFDCVQVFSAAGPLEKDDGADLGFISARVTLTGVTVHRVIAGVSPRLAAVLGQKLAAQTVPLLGAVAGAA
ncbi:MAG: EcsC family protein, partial [Roseobacter sp.]